VELGRTTVEADVPGAGPEAVVETRVGEALVQAVAQVPEVLEGGAAVVVRGTPVQGTV